MKEEKGGPTTFVETYTSLAPWVYRRFSVPFALTDRTLALRHPRPQKLAVTGNPRGNGSRRDGWGFSGTTEGSAAAAAATWVAPATGAGPSVGARLALRSANACTGTMVVAAAPAAAVALAFW